MTTTQPTPAAAAIALLPPTAPLPEPWYATDQLALVCDLCLTVVDELWPLTDYPADPAADLPPGELCVCRRCAEAVRPTHRHRRTSAAAPAA